jgi:CheY-like chemotaxis protein
VETPSLTAYSGLPARRALVVGADSETLQLCRDALESSGFVADAMDSGIAAVVAARASPPDLVLVDVQLRDVPGCEAIGWLRSNPSLQSRSARKPDICKVIIWFEWFVGKKARIFV